MKKSLVIFGLFSLMMVLTSFTSPTEIGGGTGKGTSTGGEFTDIGGGTGKGTSTGGEFTDIGGGTGKGTSTGGE